MSRRIFVLLMAIVAGLDARAQSPEHQACDQGDAEACATIGERHYDVGKEQDDPDEVTRSLPYFEKACDLGKGLACSRLGYVYATGLGDTEEDYPLSQKYYQMACDLGRNAGCMNFSMKRSLGHIYPPSGEDPDKLTLSKCEKGNPDSCYEVAAAYLGREPLHEFAAKAAPYLEQSCRGGHGQACVELAYLHKEGLGVAYDLDLVQLYREKSCAAGNVAGCNCLGWDHRKGKEGAPKDEHQSQMYFKKACDLGWDSACDRVE